MKRSTGLFLLLGLAALYWLLRLPSQKAVRVAEVRAPLGKLASQEPAAQAAVPVQVKINKTAVPQREVAESRGLSSATNSALMPARPPAFRPTRQMAEFVSPREIEINGRRLNLSNTEAVPEAGYNGEPDRVLAKVSGFLVVARDPGAEDDLTVSSTHRPVVFNPGSGMPEVISGTLIVQLSQVSAAAQIAAKYGLKMLTVDESISTAYLLVPDGANVPAEAERLRQEPDVVLVSIEMVHGNVRAR